MTEELVFNKNIKDLFQLIKFSQLMRKQEILKKYFEYQKKQKLEG